MSRNQHDRTRDHMGVEPPSAVVLDINLIPFRVGDSLVDVLVSLISVLQNAGLLQMFFTVDAVIEVPASGSFTIDADLEYGWHLNAVVKGGRSSSFTMDAVKS